MNETTVAPRIRFKGFDSGWEEKTFADLYRLNVRKNDLTYRNKDIISVAKMFYAPNPTVTDEDYLLTYNIMEKGDIAFEGNRNGNYAYGRFVENDIGNGIVSHVFQVFSPITSMDIDYWKYAINNERIMRPVLADSTKTSTMMREIIPSRFLNQKVHVPCLEEQKKIGSFLTLVDRLVALYEKVIPIFDILVRSRFIEMFGDPYTSPMYPSVPFMDCLDFNPGKSQIKDLSDDTQVSFVPMEYVGTDSSIDTSQTRLLGEVRKGYTYFRENDVVFAKISPCFENGKVAIAQGCTNGIGFGTTEFHVARPIEGVSNSIWLKQMLKSDSLRILASSNMSGSAGQKRIQQSFFERLKVGLPPISVQDEFADFVKQVDKSRFDHIKKYEALKKLRESLICGMLIPVSD